MMTLSQMAYRNRYRQKKRLRMLRISALLMVCCAVILITLLQGSIAMSEVREPLTVTVVEGDTLWQLAKNHAPRGMLTRQYLDLIYEANSLTGAIVIPGQVLILP
jgi:nucleoid-associated protein YgaU